MDGAANRYIIMIKWRHIVLSPAICLLTGWPAKRKKNYHQNPVTLTSECRPGNWDCCFSDTVTLIYSCNYLTHLLMQLKWYNLLSCFKANTRMLFPQICFFLTSQFQSIDKCCCSCWKWLALFVVVVLNMPTTIYEGDHLSKEERNKNQKKNLHKIKSAQVSLQEI